ncbi:hypothetical protein YH65_02325 [Sulfurovum lithotrophicum]|uniref:Sulfotransferase family protein n=1 Tax=Sulfurovum lithotrophicum TaxID=206403 RepID=A0A7U4RQ13_9BACT|nr:hypothetical protein [Sulfurovum lithotrophicum]AKF24360.1 hypothetical protein YH65_02325 [Sulfurovum lithotrophicum]
MENRKTVFLHSMFRAGSTYIFNKFRSYDAFYTYYEPLHHDLVRLKKESLDIWNYDKKATDVMNHPELGKPHFYEFHTAFGPGSECLPFYDTDFAYKEFFKVQKSDVLKHYIDNLIDTTPKEKIPVLQFNRTSMRIDWFKQHYADSLNLFLLRNPRDQFESYYQRGKAGKNVFLTINLYIVLLDPKVSDLLLDKRVDFNSSDNVGADLSVCMDLSKNFTIKEHYKFFYYIWVSSFQLANDHANLIVDMDKLNYDQAYLEEVKTKIHDYTLVDMDFNDYKIKNNTQLSIAPKSMHKIENSVNDIADLNDDFKENLLGYLSQLNDNTAVEPLPFLQKLFGYFKKR